MIKTIKHTDPTVFDQLVNDFEKQHSCFATQTHITHNSITEKIEYIAIIFYREAKI
jgi:hypothetical protein